MLMTYTGTCGSGKSYHAVKDIVFRLKKGGVVVTNLELDTVQLMNIHKFSYELLQERLIIVDNDEITPQFLYDIAVKFADLDTKYLLVIDEAADMFNSRDWKNADRKSWNKFFRMHRHLFYDVILISQHRRMLDKQIQWLFDVDVQHRNIKENGVIGMILGLLLPKLFLVVGVYVPIMSKSYSHFLFLLKKYYRCYDTFTLSNYKDVDFFNLSNTSVAEPNETESGDGEGAPAARASESTISDISQN